MENANFRKCIKEETSPVTAADWPSMKTERKETNKQKNKNTGF